MGRITTPFTEFLLYWLFIIFGLPRSYQPSLFGVGDPKWDQKGRPICPTQKADQWLRGFRQPTWCVGGGTRAQISSSAKHDWQPQLSPFWSALVFLPHIPWLPPEPARAFMQAHSYRHQSLIIHSALGFLIGLVETLWGWPWGLTLFLPTLPSSYLVSELSDLHLCLKTLVSCLFLSFTGIPPTPQ